MTLIMSMNVPFRKKNNAEKMKFRKNIKLWQKKEEDPEEEKISEAEKNNEMLLNYHKEQKKYKEKTKGNVPKKKASREDATLAMLAKFKQKLTKIKDNEDEAEEEKKEAGGETGGEAESDEDVAGDGWMKNTLR